jgi:hypothetical protein
LNLVSPRCTSIAALGLLLSALRAASNQATLRHFGRDN